MEYDPPSLKLKVFYGTDVKILQYEENAINRDEKSIDFISTMTSLFNKPVTPNYIMINIEKDAMRYHSCVDEMKKLELSTFVHLKATYWKEKEKHIDDLNSILQFLRQFNPQIQDKRVSMNAFSKVDDPNIKVYDGPLACWCSHLRAMIYGYQHFEEYTVIMEDDMCVLNTANITKYITMIPDDWDIICFNSAAINRSYSDPYYKFEDMFHSLHFYIIRNRCLETIFKRMYPVFDQVDVLLAHLHKDLNIYNIVDTVYQKNYSTNTQNNLYIMNTAPHYQYIKSTFSNIRHSLVNHVVKRLPGVYAPEILCNNIIADVIYSYIMNSCGFSVTEQDTVQNTMYFENYSELASAIFIIILNSVKGIRANDSVTFLLKSIRTILSAFTLHNTVDSKYNEPLLAYGYGSTSNTYILPSHDIIVKVYNSELGWATEGHTDLCEIYARERDIYAHVGGLLDYDDDRRVLYMPYKGVSLYDSFELPSDWKEQITSRFKEFSDNGINYREFHLKNILVKDGRISFIDYGLAKQQTPADNNCAIFIELLELLEAEMREVPDAILRTILYVTFINNMKLSGKYSANIF